MDENRQAVREYIASYEIGVPAELVEDAMRYVDQEMRDRLQQDSLSGRAHPDIDSELSAIHDQMRQAAFYEAKTPLVLRDIVEKQGFTVSEDDREKAMNEMAKLHQVESETVRRFFGDDFSLLDKDILERRAVGWILTQLREKEPSE